MTATESGARAIDSDRDRAETTPESETADESGRVSLLYPKYGPVDALVGFGVFYLVVDRLTPTFVESLSGVVSSVGTLLALALWVVFLATVGAQILRQVSANPRRFADRAARDAFLDTERPDERDYTLNLVLLVFGGATALLAWPTAIEFLREAVPVVVDLVGSAPAVTVGGVGTVGTVATFVVFVLGVAAYGRGLDRLVVGGMREFLYRTYSGDWDD